ncbi:hypothetical protein [Mycobacterium asiaticum]|uniref:hypothetical protein n=1 Tax=Mycobacterium asiaticum TaxID=1790 RepID=UPI0007EF2C3E|nr:hypothetical protein [Mycobacterium asiaticum]OBJ62510.1 hypothetical protein A9W94_11855 [Mycobacterium asiaticum]
MANAAGVLKESIWRDREFRALPRTAQATYAQLISQKELDRAGVQPLQIFKWAKGCDNFSAEDLMADLKVLEEHRFVFVDEDTDELFIRSYMRHCDVARYPNILKNALRCAGMVASEKLRHELAKELRRLRRADADRVADTIEPDGYEPEPPNPSGTKSNGSRTVPERLNGSGTLTEPQGYGSISGSVTLGSSQVGEAAGNPRTDKTGASRLSDDPPPERCPKHINDPDPPPCGACREARLRREAWDAEHAAALGAAKRAAAEAESAHRREQAELRAQAIANCNLCDGDGYRNGVICDHVDRTHTARAGIAAVRAALTKPRGDDRESTDD